MEKQLRIYQRVYEILSFVAFLVCLYFIYHSILIDKLIAYEIELCNSLNPDSPELCVITHSPFGISGSIFIILLLIGCNSLIFWQYRKNILEIELKRIQFGVEDKFKLKRAINKRPTSQKFSNKTQMSRIDQDYIYLPNKKIPSEWKLLILTILGPILGCLSGLLFLNLSHTPLMRPEPRYFSKPAAVAGFCSSARTALNCLP